MEIDKIVNEYRVLLKSVPDKVARAEHLNLTDVRLVKKSEAMIKILESIEHLPIDEVLERAGGSRTAPAKLEMRVMTMRQVDDLLEQCVARPTTIDLSSVRGRLSDLVGNLPGDDTTDF